MSECGWRMCDGWLQFTGVLDRGDNCNKYQSRSGIMRWYGAQGHFRWKKED